MQQDVPIAAFERAVGRGMEKVKGQPWYAVTLYVDPRSLSPMESPTLSALAPS